MSSEAPLWRAHYNKFSRSVNVYLRQHRFVYLALISLLLMIGFLMRVMLVRRGHNFDFESWKIVGDVAKDGGNVYTHTYRYNYGPVWLALLGIFRRFSLHFSNPEAVFRLAISVFLSCVDVAIWLVIKKKAGFLKAFIFFLCPISIIISGYHGQFDNLAIVIGCLAMLFYEKSSNALSRRRGLVLLGLSLVVKHLLIFFPIWLAMKEPVTKKKITIVLIPWTIFLMSFVPFLGGGGGKDIIHNVFLYKSFNNAPFWYALVPKILQNILTPSVLFAGALTLFGIVTRKFPVFKSFAFYLLVLVIFSPAIANQYLAIVVLPVVLYYNNVFTFLYMYYASLLLMISDAGLSIKSLAYRVPGWMIGPLDKGMRSYDMVMVVLFVGFIFCMFGAKVITFCRQVGMRLVYEIKIQLKSSKQT